ncbi:DJ-1 family glyoxalase III [Clostridium tarantellae]|uniref:DJ-1 family protein n=1 Tax=Clostridium tarantellae TaxID=39493 RepID=A0A6I1MG36_9CLOT|nr:DJ-1 family glyoxalase III [Clostridium tarantellae]MPQ42325.1 DJ-1 family protein [Clostridium tarantellae]
MKKVLVLLAEGFEILEALSVVDVCIRAGIKCDTCGIASNEVKSSHGIRIIADKVFNEGDLLSYDAIVLPGGMPGATNLRDDIRVLELVREYNSSGKIIAAVCAAPIVLAEAGIVSGKKITSYPGFNEQLGNCIYIKDKTVVVDENIITSRGPGTSLVFALEIIKQLGYEKEAVEIKEGMMINFFLEHSNN